MTNNKEHVANKNIDLESIVKVLFAGLTDRETGVIGGRYALDGGRIKTLEEIGKHYGVTRERIRQVENATIKKLKNSEVLGKVIEPVKNVIRNLLLEYGGVMHEQYLVDRLVADAEAGDVKKNILIFLLRNFTQDSFNCHKEHDKMYCSWRLKHVDDQFVEKTLDVLHEIFDSMSDPMQKTHIEERLSKTRHFNENKDKVTNNFLLSLLELSKLIEKNVYGEWGKANWPTVTPKKINDKIYLVLKKEGHPMHFTDIARRINEVFKDKKKAHPATVHNELILDQKYVLIGRGMYALKEWGYKPGVVADVIEEVLRTVGKPLTKDEITEHVLKQRMVKKSTIVLALMNKKKFKKLENGAYTLV